MCAYMYPSTVGHTDENVSRRYLQGMYGAIPIVNDAEFAAVLENLSPQESGADA